MAAFRFALVPVRLKDVRGQPEPRVSDVQKMTRKNSVQAFVVLLALDIRSSACTVQSVSHPRSSEAIIKEIGPEARIQSLDSLPCPIL